MSDVGRWLCQELSASGVLIYMVLNWVPSRCDECSVLIVEVVSVFPASDYLSVVSMD